jgi:hypothetical protein
MPAAKEPTVMVITSGAVPLDEQARQGARIAAADAGLAAGEARRDAETKFSANRRKWPEAVRSNVDSLIAKSGRMRFDANYRFGGGLDAKAIDGIVQGLERDAATSKWGRIATSPEQAELVVEILGCAGASRSAAAGAPIDAGLGLRVRSGPRLAGATPTSFPLKFLAGVQTLGGWAGVTVVNAPTDAEWLLEVEHPGKSQDLTETCTWAAGYGVAAVGYAAMDSRDRFLKAPKD